MRRNNIAFTMVLIGVLVAVPFGWYEWAVSYNHGDPGDTVGGPVTIGLSIILGVLCDAVLMVVAPLLWALALVNRTFAMKRRARALESVG